MQAFKLCVTKVRLGEYQNKLIIIYVNRIWNSCSQALKDHGYEDGFCRLRLKIVKYFILPFSMGVWRLWGTHIGKRGILALFLENLENKAFRQHFNASGHALKLYYSLTANFDNNNNLYLRRTWNNFFLINVLFFGEEWRRLEMYYLWS